MQVVDSVKLLSTRGSRHRILSGQPHQNQPPALFRATPARLFLVGWLGKRDATHLLPNYFAHGPVKNVPRCYYCSVARENLVICSFHCSSSARRARPAWKIDGDGLLTCPKAAPKEFSQRRGVLVKPVKRPRWKISERAGSRDQVNIKR